MSLPRIRVEELLPRLFHLRFSTQRAVASTFLRFQEYYESPNDAFRGQVFTLAAYRRWYEATRGSFSYYLDWSGFNVPGTVIADFRQGRFDPLSARERNLLTALERHGGPGLYDEPFYVIGTCGDDWDVAHETAHGLWYLSDEYRRAQSKLMERFDDEFVACFFASLGTGGYCQAVLWDELQAYILTDVAGGWFAEQGLDLAHYATTVQAMVDVFRAFTVSADGRSLFRM